eukprot:1156723-Pelagomonas_calceolata.AAC.18
MQYNVCEASGHSRGTPCTYLSRIHLGMHASNLATLCKLTPFKHLLPSLPSGSAGPSPSSDAHFSVKPPPSADANPGMGTRVCLRVARPGDTWAKSMRVWRSRAADSMRRMPFRGSQHTCAVPTY